MRKQSLLESIADPENLRAAWERVRAKGASGGLDRVSVDEFAARADVHLARLRQDLLSERYVPEPLLRVQVPKGPGKEGMRTLGLPTVRDKVAQEACRRVVEPILDRAFLDCSYGYREGKGPARAVARVTHYLLSDRRVWAARADIDDFFDSVHHDLLLRRLRAALHDEPTVRLLELWVRMGAVDLRNRWHDATAGVHQGAVISPVLANFYLSPFDQSMVARGYGLVRYADDFVLLCRSEEEARQALADATAFLTERLQLRLNRDGTRVCSHDEGFEFLGILFHQGRRTIAPAKLERMRQALASWTTRPAAERFRDTLTELAGRAAGWERYYGRLVEQESVDLLRALVAETVRTLVSNALACRAVGSLREAEACLRALSLPVPDSPAPRSDRPARKPAGTAPPAKARVRARKRRHLREQAEAGHLVVEGPGTFVGLRGERVVVRRERRIVGELPLFRAASLTVSTRGNAVSGDLLEACLHRGVPLVLVDGLGRPLGAVTPVERPPGSATHLQIRALGQGKPAFDLAKQFALGKVRNQVNTVKYFAKYEARRVPTFQGLLGQHVPAMEEVRDQLRRLPWEGDLEAARSKLFGLEARAANHYWALFAALLEGRAEFPGRRRRGATDLVNCLLNYGYALLLARTHVELLRVGLEPTLGFLHTPGSKPSLAFDLMETFRPVVVDRVVLVLLRRGEKVQSADGTLTPATRRLLFRRVTARLASVVRYRSRARTLQEVLQAQASLLKRHLAGEARFRPFVVAW